MRLTKVLCAASNAFVEYCSGREWTLTWKTSAEIARHVCGFSHYDETHLIQQLHFHCWETCALDLVGPFPGEIYIMTVVDYRSKWPEAIVLKRITSKSIITVLTDIFARFGNPKVLITDNGRQFIAEEFQDFIKANGIQHKRVSPYFPQANGQVERFHRYLKHSVRAAELDGLS